MTGYKHWVWVLLAASLPLKAQDVSLAAKYGHYRERLTTHFMVVGPGPGESIPAGIRNLRSWEDGDATALHWGDATLYLGWYLGVLATEYRLVQQSGGTAEATASELYYALQALDRLDSVAETKWGLPGTLDGFLVRDDVPAGFIAGHPALNAGVKHDPPWLGQRGVPGRVRTLYSDHSQMIPHAFSQDQICHLLMGLALTKKFAGTDMWFREYAGDGSADTIRFDARAHAVAITHRMITGLQRRGLPRPWQLINPDGTAVTNARGGDCRANATGLAAAAHVITGEKYHDFLTRLPLGVVWQAQQVLEALRLNSSSLHMALVLAAVGDSWRGILGHKTTLHAILENGRFDQGAVWGIAYRKNDYGWDNFYGYLLTALHRNKKIHFASSIEILNAAPADGPFFHNRNDKAAGGWAASRRFVDNPGRQDNGSMVFPGNYNGLDYMLFYNLFLLADTEGEKFLSGYLTERLRRQAD